MGAKSRSGPAQGRHASDGKEHGGNEEKNRGSGEGEGGGAGPVRYRTNFAVLPGVGKGGCRTGNRQCQPDSGSTRVERPTGRRATSEGLHARPDVPRLRSHS